MPAVTATRSPSQSPSDRSISATGGTLSRYGPDGSSPKPWDMARTKAGHSSGVAGRSWVARSSSVTSCCLPGGSDTAPSSSAPRRGRFGMTSVADVDDEVVDVLAEAYAANA